MKKILLMVATVAMLVACGGNGKQAEAKKTVEEQAAYYVNELLKAQQTGDYGKYVDLSEEMDKWIETLSETDLEKVELAAEKAAMAFYASSTGADEYGDWDDEDYDDEDYDDEDYDDEDYDDEDYDEEDYDDDWDF